MMSSKQGAAGKSYVSELVSRNEQLEDGYRGNRLIDIEKVWQNHSGPPLSHDLKDTCLSFSLFHLLRRRFFGFECGESSQPKTHDFVFRGLLARKKKKKNAADGAASEAAEATTIDYDRVFKVIEVELAFMYDFFFTKYAALYYGRYFGSFVVPVVTASLTVVAAFFTAGGVLATDMLVILDTTEADVGITVAILMCISFLQVLQMLHYWTTIWARVSFACQRVKGGRWCMGVKDLLVQVGVFLSSCYWYQHQQKLGQYSLLESVSNSSKLSMAIKDMFLSSYVLDILEIEYVHGGGMDTRVCHVIRKPGEPTELLPSLKKALVQSLERSQGKLTNGESSLSSNRAENLLWACRLSLSIRTGTSCSQKEENQACVILTWHIATCYCDMELSGAAITEDIKEHHAVATTLSKYSAYLVGFQPKLLPGHHYDTWFVFKQVATEADQIQRRLGGLHPSMMRFLDHSFFYRTDHIDSSQQQEETIYKKGLMLREQLKNMEATRCWKILADFWAEMLLYLAPSDNVREHVECLVKGGELITHLWALLTHAGILDRGKRNNVTNDPENPGDGPSSNTDSGTSTACTAAPSTWDTNEPPTTSNPTVQRTETDVGETGTDQSDPRELSNGAALRFRCATTSYLNECAGDGSAADCATNKPALHGNSAQTVEMVVHQPANPVQNGEGARNESNGLSEIEEIAE